MNKIKECWNCKYYRPFYTKGFCEFSKHKIGYCRDKNEIILDKHKSCDCWRNDSVIRNMRQVVAIKKIDEMQNCLVEIRQILAEEKQELQKPEISVVDYPDTNSLYKEYLSA